jgi:hypothetical protein
MPPVMLTAKAGKIVRTRNVNHLTRVLICWAAAAWGSGAWTASAATLRVSVADPSGAPIPGATVRVSAGASSFAATTDARGRASVGRLPVGEVTLRVEAASFIARSQSVMMRAGENRISWQLRMAPHRDAITVSPGENDSSLAQPGKYPHHIAMRQHYGGIPLHGFEITAVEPVAVFRG